MRSDDPFHRRGDASRSRDPSSIAARPTRMWLLAAIAFGCGIVVAFLATHGSHTTASRAGVPHPETTRLGRVDADGGRAAGGLAGGSATVPPARRDGSDAPPADMPICGMPGMALNPATTLSDDPRFAARIDAANARFIEALSRHADERVRAAGLLLERNEALRLARRSEAAAIGALCGPDALCISAAARQTPPAAVLQSMAPATDALARVAANSSSPAVYASAIDACTGWNQSATPVPACALLSAEQWARLDPDNADAWLHVAGGAAARKDAAGLDDAMNHVAHAKGNRIYGDTIAALIDQAVPPGSDDFDASQMHVAAWTVLAGWSLPPLQTVMAYCAEPLLADGNRSQTCDAVAHQLVDNGSSLIERSIGVRLGSRLGWSAETVAALRQEQDALRRAQGLGLDRLTDVTSCSGVARLRAMVTLAGQAGEVGAARAALAASGRSVADLAAEADVERASSAASEPPASAPARAASATSVASSSS